MSLSDQLLAALLMYGLPVLFCVTVVSAIGLPLPDGLVLIAAGSFIKQGDLSFGPAWLVSTIGAVMGDQIGYLLALRIGPRLASRLSSRLGGAAKIEKAEAHMRDWGGLTVFLSRWLVTALGPWVNLACGFAGYTWPRFLLLATVGDAIWAFYNLLLGYAFSEQVQDIGDAASTVTWIGLGVLVAVLLIWWLMRAPREARAS